MNDQKKSPVIANPWAALRQFTDARIQGIANPCQQVSCNQRDLWAQFIGHSHGAGHMHGVKKWSYMDVSDLRQPQAVQVLR